MQGDEGKRESREPTPPGPLAMRDLTPKAAIEQRSTSRSSARALEQQEEGKGDLPMARVGRDGQRAVGAEPKGGKVNLTSTTTCTTTSRASPRPRTERRQAARARGSHVAGRWDRYLQKAQAMRSSIENFTSDVRAGQSGGAGHARLAVRRVHHRDAPADPQAVHVRLPLRHRRAQRLGRTPTRSCGRSSRSSSRATARVEKVGIVHGSGVLAFDVAAIDSSCRRRRSRRRRRRSRAPTARSTSTGSSTATSAPAAPSASIRTS